MPFSRPRHLRVERGLLPERVAQRDQEEVEVDEVEEARDHAGLVDAGTNRPDQPRRLQLGERPVAAWWRAA